MTKAHPVNPQRVTWELSPRLPVNAIVTSDSGSCANWYARDLKVRRGQMYSLSGGLASMGAAVPYAIGAKFAHPGRPVIALVGDGAMQMNNMAELITVAKYWRNWANPKWIYCVWNNGDLNQVTWEQRIMEGCPPPGARLAGAVVLGATALVMLVVAAEWRGGARAGPAIRRVHPPASSALPVAQLRASSALLSLAVLADSAVEHTRGAYENPGMYAPLASAALGLAADARAMAWRRLPRPVWPGAR